MSAAAVIIVRQNRCLRVFQEAGATAPERARNLADLGLRESRTFRRLLHRGYIVAAAGGYYLNPVRLAERRRRLRIVAAILFTALLCLAVSAGARLFRGR